MRELGRGGTAVVYLALERELGRLVAIKVIHPALAVDSESVQRLIREARTLARLNHPNIITLYGTRRLADGRLALVMQYAGGDTLRARLRSIGSLSFAAATAVLRDIAGALAHAHRQRIVHRDVKPENIHLDAGTGRAHLSDFGIARIWDHDANLTLGGTTVGTPTYMSPEQIEGVDIDGRSDLYSLGLVGWEMLTGRRPWAGENLYSIVYKQKHESLPPLSDLCPGIPQPLCTALEVALAKDPEARWPDAEAFLRQIDGLPSSPVPAPRIVARSARHGVPVSPPPVSTSAPDSGGDMAELPTVRLGPTLPGGARVASGSEAGRRRGRTGLIVLVTAVLGLALGAAGLAIRRNPASAEPLADTESAELSEAGSAAARGRGESSDDAAAAQSPEPEPEPAAAVPARLRVLSGDLVQGPPLASLLDTVALRVEDAEGRPLSGVAVNFRVVEGGGSIQAHAPVSDADGLVRASWTLGPDEEVNRALAIVVGLPGVGATFEASARRPELLPRPEVVVGGAHTCVLTGAGQLSCWGANDRGQTGVGGRTVLTPTTVSAPAALVTVSAGAFHTCALSGAGSALCWGANERGQLGTGTRTGSALPASVSGDVAFTRISAGLAHTCALTQRGAVYCWGANERGQLGDGTQSDRPVPTPTVGSRSFRALAAGWSHTCAIDQNERAHCWGDNRYGQIGDDTNTDRPAPVPVAGALQVRALAVGSAHTCGLTADGAAYCWGRNDVGQLGTGDLLERRVPSPIALETPLVQVSAGGVHTCGLSTDGRAYCWGRNIYGQLGDGTTIDRSFPTPVAGEHRFATIQANGAHTCARALSGVTYCWGYNADGQLGDGTRVNQLRPVAIQPGR